MEWPTIFSSQEIPTQNSKSVKYIDIKTYFYHFHFWTIAILLPETFGMAGTTNS
jgi:hypothetical protein